MDARWVMYYDKIYSFKDYRGEVEKLNGFIGQFKRSAGRRLLDVACGTGRHLEFLGEMYDCEGLDLESGLLEAARVRNPGMSFHEGDMRTFELRQQFDAITCLFSAIGHMLEPEDLQQAIFRMAAHLTPGGVLLVEPWFTPEAWHPGRPHMVVVDEPAFKLARGNTSLPPRGRVTVLDFHYLICTNDQTETAHDVLELSLYSLNEMRAAFELAGLETVYEETGITGRGLWIGVKPGPVPAGSDRVSGSSLPTSG